MYHQNITKDYYEKERIYHNKIMKYNLNIMNYRPIIWIYHHIKLMYHNNIMKCHHNIMNYHHNIKLRRSTDFEDFFTCVQLLIFFCSCVYTVILMFCNYSYDIIICWDVLYSSFCREYLSVCLYRWRAANFNLSSALLLKIGILLQWSALWSERFLAF